MFGLQLIKISSKIVFLYCLQIFFLLFLLCSSGIQNGNTVDARHIIRLRGLPWAASVHDIIKFLKGCNIKNETSSIFLTVNRDGRPSGEAFVELETEEDLEMACAKDQDYLDQRYIEVLPAEEWEAAQAIKRSRLYLLRTHNDGCVQIRGLPYKCSEYDIVNFFSGLEIVPEGIVFKRDEQGRKTGEAYVQFTDKNIAEKALELHKQKLAERYIEVFRSSLSEVRLAKLKLKELQNMKLTPVPNIYSGIKTEKQR